jgi:hypothetical protein
MKLIIILFLCTLLLSIEKIKAQTYPTPITDTANYLRYIVANKQQFIGQPFSTLYNFLQISPKMFTPRAGIHHNSYAETSITLSFKFVATAEELSTTYPHLKIAWQPPYLNREEGLDMKFLYQRQGVGWNTVIYNRYQNIIIKDIYILQ